ncbi:MAG: ABC transporter ATP-binding protein [Clostridia bacterium]|nr:ABC transporter ATP-binding protein [Clostridia bacterium]
MKKLFPFFKGYRTESFLAPFFKLLEAIFELLVPLVVAAIIDVGLPSGDRGFVIRRVLLLAALGIIGFVSAVTAQYFSAKAATGFSAAVRKSVFSHTEALSFSSIDRLGIPTIINRMTADVEQLQTGVNLFLRLFMRSPFIVFGAMIMAFTLDAKAALIFLLVIVLLFIVVFAVMLISIPLYQKVQGRLDALLQRTRENLTGARVLRAFCKEADETAAFKTENQALTRMQTFVGRISALMNPLTLILVNLAVVLLIHTGAIKVDAGLMTQGTVVALYNYMAQILVELIKLANLIITLTRAVASARRVSQLLEIPSRITDGDDAATEKTEGDVITFANVSFTYDRAGEPTLSDISFSVKPGETIGVIGGTGSGKSTLMSLLARFYAVTSGEIRLNGVEITRYAEKELRRRIGFVLQKSVLFRGTLRENMQWEKADATDEEILEALSVAQGTDILNAKPEGLDMPVEEGGRNFSGGQRQRLSIARTLVKKPDILILDDSSSALDYVTEANLRRSLKNMSYRPTLFIVSQRASAVMHADRILLLEDGRLTAIGTHQELLQNSAAYREIYASQCREEAVADA